MDSAYMSNNADPFPQDDTLQEDEFFGYSADSGTGCFMDADAAQAYEKKLDEEKHYVSPARRLALRPHPTRAEQARHRQTCFAGGARFYSGSLR
jgi:hypothetical protein